MVKFVKRVQCKQCSLQIDEVDIVPPKPLTSLRELGQAKIIIASIF